MMHTPGWAWEKQMGHGAWFALKIKVQNNQDGMGRNKLGKGFDFLSIV